MYAIVDCNNFYASCQRIFRPELEGKPIVVLSNNDGCIIARSNEAKRLGVPMAAPEYKWQGFFKANDIHVFSSNYALYGDMSSRVMSILERFHPNIEVYSIDEAFINFSSVPKATLHEHARELHEVIKQWLGLPVSIGIAPTKTLAKLANHISKKDPKLNNVLVLSDKRQAQLAMKKVAIGNVWGVGRRWAEALQHNGIRTAADLANADHRWIRQRYSVVLQRTAMELAGISCIEMADTPDRKQILVSRSFRPKVTEYGLLRQFVAGYVSRAAEKLRSQHSLAKNITIFIRTKSERLESSHANTRSINLSQYTADTATLIRAAGWAVKQMYQPGMVYYRAGIMFNDLIPDKNQQLCLFSNANYNEQSRKRMRLLDDVNRKFGSETLCFASEPKQRWQMHQNHLSPAYTTRWDDLLEVN
ncbi:MAG: Y-family DNA polymerase [Thiotrichaceae bacterium]